MNIEVISLKEKHKRERKEVESDLQSLRNATGFSLVTGDGYLKYGSAFDSSDRKVNRMMFVERAINSMQDEILEEATRICSDYLGYEESAGD